MFSRLAGDNPSLQLLVFVIMDQKAIIFPGSISIGQSKLTIDISIDEHYHVLTHNRYSLFYI